MLSGAIHAPLSLRPAASLPPSGIRSHHRQFNLKSGAVLVTRRPDRSVVQIHDIFGNGKTQTGPPVFKERDDSTR